MLRRIVPLHAVTAAAAIVILTAACSPPDEPPFREPDLIVVAIASDVVVGENRVPLAVLLPDRSRVVDAADRLTLTAVHDESGAEGSISDVQYRPWPGQGGVYTTRAGFDRPGVWYIEVRYEDAGTERSDRAAVLVRGESSTPAIGAAPPATSSKTAATPEELRQITSDPDPNPALYGVSVDEAARSGIPAVVTFATPAFCQTATCGPQMEVLGALQQRYEGQAHFIHVEIFDNPAEMLDSGDLSAGVESPIVRDWGLVSEPFTFILDRSGLVAHKFEAFTTEQELDEAIRAVLD